MIEVLQLLNEMDHDRKHYRSKSYYVRHLGSYEAMPTNLNHGLDDHPTTMRDWIWVAFEKWSAKPLAMLVASPSQQGCAHLLRLVKSDDANTAILTGVFRKALEDILARGYSKYMVCLGDSPAEAKLARLVRKFGGRPIAKVELWAGPNSIREW